MTMQEFIMTHTLEEYLAAVEKICEENNIPPYDENNPPSIEEIEMYNKIVEQGFEKIES